MNAWKAAQPETSPAICGFGVWGQFKQRLERRLALLQLTFKDFEVGEARFFFLRAQRVFVFNRAVNTPFRTREIFSAFAAPHINTGLFKVY